MLLFSEKLLLSYDYYFHVEVIQSNAFLLLGKAAMMRLRFKGGYATLSLWIP